MLRIVRPDLAVILAAGGGARMGRPKGLLELDGRALVLHHVAALAAHADQVVVVVGAAAEAHRAILGDTPLVENPDWQHSWPADSLRRALDAYPEARVCLVQPVDTPPAHPSTVSALLDAGAPAVPIGPEGPGHPVLLGPAEVAALRRRSPDGGLRTLLRDAPGVPVDQSNVARDFDDLEAWGRFLRGTGDG